MAELSQCPECGRAVRVPDNLVRKTVRCPTCGATFTATGDRDGSPPPLARRRHDDEPSPYEEDDRGRYGRDDFEDSSRRPRRSRESNAFGVTALILGICSIPLVCVCGLFGIPISILAIVFGCIGLNREGHGMAVAGLIMGIATIALAVIALIFGLAMMNMNPRFGR